MRYFTCLLVALCISSSTLCAANPNGQQPSTSEKQQVSKQATQNPEAYALYMKGRSYWDKRTLSDLETAVSYFTQAIAKDPGYAMAYAALADAYAVLPDYGGSSSEDTPKAKAAALKALELEPAMARPHAVLAYTKFDEWDFAGGEAEFKKALALDPDDATTHAWYAESIAMIGGREQEAVTEANRAHQFDPRSAVIRFDLGRVHILARQYDEAIAVCKELADENPTFALAHTCLSDAYWRKRMYAQSIEEYKSASKLSGDRNDFEYASAMDQGFRSGGWEGSLRKGIEASLAQRKTGDSSAYGIATMYAELGDKDQAFEWLNTSYQERDTELMGLKTEASFDPIRSDPRFAELVRKVGLPPTPAADELLWPTKGWATASPATVGIDEQVLLGLDRDMASGKYSQMIDSFAVFRCGKKVFERTYPHDYAKIYGKEAGERGAYNMRLTGRYNYFDPYWHPYYHGTDLHTMQSISKTVTSVILGAAIERGDFKASLDTPVLKYFDLSKVKNVDDRKRRMTLRDLLTMASGLEWNATDFENTGNPQNDTSQMEASDDWVQYTIDKHMAAEPGKVWNYNDGGAVLLAYIFQKETGWDIDDYGQKYLFVPLGIRHEWKRSYLGVVDAEGGLYLTGSDLAKIGYLYLNDGMWDGRRIVSSKWVKESVTPYLQTDEPQVKYGFSGQWFISKLPGRTDDVWLSDGYGYQELMVFPEDGLIVTITAWDVLPSSPGKEPKPPDFLPLVKTKSCPDTTDGQPSTSEKQQVSKQATQNPEAYALYLKARSYWAKRTRADLETAVSYFNQAIAKDPGYASAYAGLADCYAMLPVYGASAEDIPKAKAAALKAIELDPTLSRPHVNLGGMKMAHWDFAGGEAEFKKALELDPNDAHAHQRYADNLDLLGGREQDALAEINRAHQLDPGSLAISVDVGNVYTFARRFDEAIVVCQKVANENPTFADAHSCLANAYWGKKMYPQVIEEWKAYAKLTGEQSDSDYAASLEQGFRSGGWKGALSKSIETLKAQRKAGSSVTYIIAEAYAELGDKEQAFQWLNTAFQEHDEGLMGLRTDFTLDPIRSDPRFAELVRKVGLPQ